MLSWLVNYSNYTMMLILIINDLNHSYISICINKIKVHSNFIRWPHWKSCLGFCYRAQKCKSNDQILSLLHFERSSNTQGKHRKSIKGQNTSGVWSLQRYIRIYSPRFRKQGSLLGSFFLSQEVSLCICLFKLLFLLLLPLLLYHPDSSLLCQVWKAQR